MLTVLLENGDVRAYRFFFPLLQKIEGAERKKSIVGFSRESKVDMCRELLSYVVQTKWRLVIQNKKSKEGVRLNAAFSPSFNDISHI